MSLRRPGDTSDCLLSACVSILYGRSQDFLRTHTRPFLPSLPVRQKSGLLLRSAVNRKPPEKRQSRHPGRELLFHPLFRPPLNFIGRTTCKRCGKQYTTQPEYHHRHQWKRNSIFCNHLGFGSRIIHRDGEWYRCLYCEKAVKKVTDIQVCTPSLVLSETPPNGCQGAREKNATLLRRRTLNRIRFLIVEPDTPAPLGPTQRSPLPDSVSAATHSRQMRRVSLSNT